MRVRVCWAGYQYLKDALVSSIYLHMASSAISSSSDEFFLLIYQNHIIFSFLGLRWYCINESIKLRLFSITLSFLCLASTEKPHQYHLITWIGIMVVVRIYFTYNCLIALHSGLVFTVLEGTMQATGSKCTRESTDVLASCELHKL